MPGRLVEALGLDQQDCPVCLAALIYLRWADFQEAEQEAVAAFDDAPFEPVLPAGLHWRTWHSLPANHLRTFLLEQLTSALERLNNTRHNTLATNLHRLAPALRKLEHVAPDALAGLVLWLADQPFETPMDRRALLGTFDAVLEQVGARHGTGIPIPDGLARLMVELAAPVAGDLVYDPCFGYGGLLTSACDHVRLAEKGRFSRTGAPGVHVSGVEQHQDVFVIGMARLALAGVEEPQLELGNALQRVPAGNPQRDGFDVALAVPPPGLRVSLSGLSGMDHFPVQTSDGGGLFIQHVLSQLRPDGRAVILVPEGLLFRNSEQRLRRLLLDQHGVEAVIGMPESTSPFMSIRTSLLVLRRNGPTRRIRMADAGPFFFKSTGNTPATPAEKRTAELVQCIRSPEPAQDCWDVEVDQLADKDWDLTPKRRIQGELDGVLSELQPGVEIRPLEECCRIFSGQAFRKEELVDEPPLRFVDPEKNSFQPEQDTPTRNGPDIPVIPYIRIKDIQQGQATSGSSWLSPARASTLDAKWKLKPGDVLLSKSGTIGKTGIVRNEGVGAVAANGLFVLRVEQSLIDPHFLLAYLESNACRAWFAGHARGTTILHLSGKALQALPVPLPPLPVQQRVVSECKARGGDALAVLSQLLLERESDPVAQWLDQALLFLRRKHGSEGAVSDVSLLMHPHVFGETLEAVRASLARQETASSLAPWLRAMSQAADALGGLDDIPPGTAAFTLLQQSAGLVRSAEALLTGHQPVENRARELTGLVAAVVEAAMTALVENVRVEVSAETDNVEKDAAAHIEARITNQGILPLRNVLVSTQPDWGGAQIGYLGEQVGKTFSLTGTPDQHSETFSLHVSWSGLRMDGQSVEGKREIVFTVAKSQTDPKTILPDLGGSPYVCGDPVGPDNHEVFFGREDILS